MKIIKCDFNSSRMIKKENSFISLTKNNNDTLRKLVRRQILWSNVFLLLIVTFSTQNIFLYNIMTDIFTECIKVIFFSFKNSKINLIFFFINQHKKSIKKIVENNLSHTVDVMPQCYHIAVGKKECSCLSRHSLTLMMKNVCQT